MAYGDGATIQLRGNSSERLELRGSQGARIQWLPADRRALDLEVRLRVVATQLPFGDSPPVINWRTEVAQGAYVWSEPPQSYPVFSDTTFGLLWHYLPGRGEVFRVPSRELTLNVYCPYRLDGTPAPETTVVAVSFIPTDAMDIDVWPKQRVYPIDAIANSTAAAIPIGSTEFRAFDANSGAPMAAGALTLATLTGQPLTFIALADLADWRPLPPDAFSLHSVDGPFALSFR
jgi:hypothetical protein